MNIVLFANYPAAPFNAELGLKKICDKRITTWNINLLKGLTAYKDLNLQLITTTKCFPDIRTIRKDNVTATFIGLPPKINSLSLYRYPIWKSREIIRDFKPDLIHGIGTEHIWAYASMQFRRPEIITVHGILNELKKSNGYPFLSRNNYLAHLEKKVIRNARYLIAITPYAEKILKEYGFAGKVFHIENPVSELFIRNQASPDKSNQVLFVGDVEPNKNPGMLVRACELIRNRKITVKIIGKIKDRQYYESVFSNAVNHTYRISHSYLAQPELLEEMMQSAILALCSIQETAPMVISEAQSLGLPVVATRTGGIEHMVRHEVNGFTVEPGNTDQFRNSIETLLDDPGLRRLFGKHARKEAILRHRPEVVAEKTVAAYREVYAHEKQ